MSANVSARAARNTILASPVADCRDDLLSIGCEGRECRGARSYRIADLARHAPPGETMSAMIQRLRCHSCGGRAVSVTLVSGPRQPAREVPLIGPAARE